jgi:hypothetical protein
MRGCVPIDVQEGAMAVYWPSPAAGAMRLAVLRLRRDAWFDSDQRATRGCGWVLAITRGWRHAAHGASPATQCVAAGKRGLGRPSTLSIPSAVNAVNTVNTVNPVQKPDAARRRSGYWMLVW